MTEEQYLDAISAPRIDPINQGKKVMMSRPWSSSGDEGILESTDEEIDSGEEDQPGSKASIRGSVSDSMELDQ